MKRLICFMTVALLLLSVTALGQDTLATSQKPAEKSQVADLKEQADLAYLKGNYQQAIKDYEQLLTEGMSSEVYFNLGNAYYRTNNITKAILAYERALKLSPTDKAAKYNLQFVRQQTIDKITPKSEMFFITWFRGLLNIMDVDSWAMCSIISLILSLILLLVFLFISSDRLRLVSFWSGCAMLLLCLLSIVFAFVLKHYEKNSLGAIVVSPTVNVKKTPSENGSDSFVIHEGTHVTITDKTLEQWRSVVLDDGRTGWLLTNEIEEI